MRQVWNCEVSGIDASASQEYKMVVFYPCCGDYGDYLRGFFSILSYPASLRFHPGHRAVLQRARVVFEAWVSRCDEPPANDLGDNKQVVLL